MADTVGEPLDFVEEKCRYKKDGRLYRVAEFTRTPDNKIIVQKAKVNGDGDEWENHRTLGRKVGL